MESHPESTAAPVIPAPEDLGPRGAEFWESTLHRFELAEHERELLREACRTLDELDALREVLRDDGPVTRGSMGQPVAHPALGELRGARQILGRLLKQLDLPDDEAGAVPDVLAERRSERARYAATVRWNRG